MIVLEFRTIEKLFCVWLMFDYVWQTKINNLIAFDCFRLIQFAIEKFDWHNLEIHLSHNSNFTMRIALHCFFKSREKRLKKIKRLGAYLRKTVFCDFFSFSIVQNSSNLWKLFKMKRFNIHVNFFNIPLQEQKLLLKLICL